MSYTDKPQTFTFNVNTADSAGAIADNTDVFNIVIPAGREIEIQNLTGFVRAASDGSDFIELCKDDNTVLCKIALASTGAKSAVLSDGTTSATFPIRVAPQSSSALTTVKLRSDGATDTTTDVTVHISISGL